MVGLSVAELNEAVQWLPKAAHACEAKPPAELPRKAKSAIYVFPDEKLAMSTLDALVWWTKRVTANGTVWVERLSSIEPPQFRAVLDPIPDDRITSMGRDFTQGLLEENRRRSLETFDE